MVKQFLSTAQMVSINVKQTTLDEVASDDSYHPQTWAVLQTKLTASEKNNFCPRKIKFGIRHTRYIATSNDKINCGPLRTIGRRQYFRKNHQFKGTV